MISLNQCLTSLVEFIASGEDQPMSLAKGYVDAFVPLIRADRAEGARRLSDLKGQLSRRTEPSALRDDVLELIEARIFRLSDAEDDLDS
jgi:hypothetical protein